MTTEQLLAWRRRLGLSQVDAARRLGLARRMLQYYEAGEHPIPRTLELATRAIEHGLDGDRNSQS